VVIFPHQQVAKIGTQPLPRSETTQGEENQLMKSDFVEKESGRSENYDGNYAPDDPDNGL
jgi:hypothetical protein